MLVTGGQIRPRVSGVLLLLAPWLAVPAAIVVVFGLFNHAFAVVSLLILWPLWTLSAILSALWCGYRVWKRGWWLGLFALILPAAMLFNASGMFYAPAYVGDVIRFAAMKPSYDRRVADLSHDPHSPIPEFNWGGMLFASDGVVYDESDEIARPKERRSAAWQAREKDTDLMCGRTDLVGDVQPLWGHYYLTAFGC